MNSSEFDRCFEDGESVIDALDFSAASRPTAGSEAGREFRREVSVGPRFLHLHLDDGRPNSIYINMSSSNVLDQRLCEFLAVRDQVVQSYSLYSISALL